MKQRKRRGNGAERKARKRRRVDSLRRYLNDFGKGEEGRRARNEFAERVGTTLPYLEHIVQGFRVCSMALAIKIEQATYGIVRCEDLHPSDDWGYLTQRKPGLAERSHA